MAQEEERKAALKKAKALDERQALAELKKSGVNDLNDLVKARLQELKGKPEDATEEGGGVLIYRGFIYFWID